MRLDSYLATHWPERSRSQWQKHIKLGHVQVNGAPQHDTNYDVTEQSTVTPKVPDSQPATVDIPVIYQDNYVVVYNKPSGLLTHAKGVMLGEFTLADAVRPISTDNPESNRPGIVHRLDRDTSGVIIAALDPETKHLLQKQFQDRKAKKAYLAVVKGTPKIAQAIIDLPIERNPKLPSTFRVGASGKSAKTEYAVLASNAKYSVVLLKPTTGRTHQLRVHMAHIGTPIIGDPIYNGGKSPIGRLCLHAQSLEITTPVSTRRTFTADLPKDFEEFVKSIKND